ncbi:RNA helicase [Schizosaccharomyces japonicus yFS275]|uniref:ATP-dependent RNA helicase n=1 Tax=Schizosaccharomyces japonicus (strain yFS275 / FY16936) TaxID=402676 RepID=B6JWW2_SCHJY|nr:RNA helicase [Schizosaccharomyces japonicus yFS275]EEB05863.1 RNA helicase [Schizosaccharomyces japonicus yFS275]
MILLQKCRFCLLESLVLSNYRRIQVEHYKTVVSQTIKLETGEPLRVAASPETEKWVRRFHPVGTPFQKLPLDHRIQANVKAHFPKVSRSNDIQEKIVSAITLGKTSFVVRSWNGSGKSFATLAAMLSIALSDQPKPAASYSATILYVVPSDSLVEQLYRWSQLLAGLNCPVYPLIRLPYGQWKHGKLQQARVVIASVDSLAEWLSSAKIEYISFLQGLKRVVLDESDQIIEGFAAPYQNRRAGPVMGIENSPKFRKLFFFWDKFYTRTEQRIRSDLNAIPQFVLLSATNTSSIANAFGLFSKHLLGCIGLDQGKHWWDWGLRMWNNIEHISLRLSGEDTKPKIRDVQFQVAKSLNSYEKAGSAPVTIHELDTVLKLYTNALLLIVRKEHKQVPTFMGDLLVLLPEQANIVEYVEQNAALYEQNSLLLRRLDTFNLKKKEERRAHQIAYVGKLTDIFGLSLFGLTHVFQLWNTFSAVVYQHVAGRVGSFGKKGKVISFFAPAYTNSADIEAHGYARMISLVYQKLAVIPKRYMKYSKPPKLDVQDKREI